MQRGTGSSYSLTENYTSGGSIVQSDLSLINVIPSRGAHAPYMQGPVQWASEPINLSLPAIVSLNLEIGADGPSAALASYSSHPGGSMIDFNAPYTTVHGGFRQVLGSTYARNISSQNQLWYGSATYQPAIIPRNYFSFWIPEPILANSSAPSVPIMHAPRSFVPPHSPWNWTYSLIQVPSMYPMSGTIGSEVIPHQDSLPLVPANQFPQISHVLGAERVIRGENMVVNSSFEVQQLNFPVIHNPRFTSDHFWHLPFPREVHHAPGHSQLHTYNFHMARNGGGQNGVQQTLYIDIDNMSYEGLLAFQNQIGFVSSGLSKEVIFARLKCIKYQSIETPVDGKDRCGICLDDYCDGQFIGFSDCGHKFHFDCITEWLMQKNSCPFCRSTALRI